MPGSGVGSATVDVALSAVGVLSPVLAAGQALNAAHALEHGAGVGAAPDKACPGR